METLHGIRHGHLLTWHRNGEVAVTGRYTTIEIFDLATGVLRLRVDLESQSDMPEMQLMFVGHDTRSLMNYVALANDVAAHRAWVGCCVACSVSDRGQSADAAEVGGILRGQPARALGCQSREVKYTGMGELVSFPRAGASAPAMAAGSSGQGFGTRDVAELLGWSVAQVMAFVRAGLVVPARLPSGRLGFGFQDVALLRGIKNLVGPAVTPQRLRRALAVLRAQLPHERPLSGVRLAVEDRRLVAQEGRERWIPESGQRVFNFERRSSDDVASLTARQAVVELALVADAADSAAEEHDPGADLIAGDTWYAKGCELEDQAPSKAAAAYRTALEENPTHPDAHINLGRILHEAGRIEEAVVHYEAARNARPGDPISAFNLGVALQDLGAGDRAVVAYEHALSADPSFADAHCNLARLFAEAGDAQSALRHYHTYRQLKKEEQ